MCSKVGFLSKNQSFYFKLRWTVWFYIFCRTQQGCFFLGNTELLQLSPQTLHKKKVVCSDHFEDKDFLNPRNKSRLNSSAVPTKWEPASSSDSSPILTVIKPSRTYSAATVPSYSPVGSYSQENTSPTYSLESSDTKQFLSDITNMPEQVPTGRKRHVNIGQAETSAIKRRKQATDNHRNLLQNKRSLIAQLKKRSKKYKRESSMTNVIENAQFSSSYSKTLVKMQMLHKPGQTWTKEEREFALLTYYKSPAAYKFWRNKLKILLPSVSTLKTWIGDSTCAPGFNKNF